MFIEDKATGRRYPANLLEIAGDLMAMANAAGLGSVFPVDRGIYPTTAYRRIARATDPDNYVPGNIWQSGMNAYAKLREYWGTSGASGGPGENAWGELELPPGVHQLNDEFRFHFSRNLVVRGAGGQGDEGTSGPGGFDAGGGMTQLLAPSGVPGKHCIYFDNRAPDYPFTPRNSTNGSGPTVTGLHCVGNASAAGGIRIRRHNNFRIIGVTSSMFSNGFDLTCDGTGDVCQYGHVQRFIGFGSKVGIDMIDADATFVDVLLSGNRNHQDPIIANSVGFREYRGGNRSLGMKIQGYSTLHHSLAATAVTHYGLRLEDWSSSGYALRVGAAVDANTGGQYFIQSANNSLQGSLGTAIRLEAGCADTYIVCQHVRGVQNALQDVSGNNTNNSFINGQWKLGSFVMNNAGIGMLQMFDKVYASGLGWEAVGGPTPAETGTEYKSRTPSARLPVQDVTGTVQGYLYMYPPEPEE